MDAKQDFSRGSMAGNILRMAIPMTIAQMVNDQVVKVGEKISIRRFVRYEMGEGLEKRQDNFAEEVMGQIK